MPSGAISREDVRAALYSAGITHPRKLHDTMRVVDIYAVQYARRAEALEEIEITSPAFTPLKPGEWSAALGVTCCTVCEKVKRWDFFHEDSRQATGHRLECKDCRNKKDEDAGLPPYVPEKVKRGGWLCTGEGSCGQRKLPEEFPEEKRRHPRKAVLCLDCGEG
jgi:hypothetical protein